MIKTFKLFEENGEMESKDIFMQIYQENPLHKTHDFFVFIYEDGFKELPNGDYKKTLDIENMHKITEDNFKDMKMMKLRTIFIDKKIGVIWWPKGGIDMIDGKSSNDMSLSTVELIRKHMSKYNRKKSIEIVNMVKDRISSVDIFNI